MTLSDVIKEVSLSVVEVIVIWVNFSLPFRDYFIALVLSWPDAIDPIYQSKYVPHIFTLNRFSTDSNPDMPLLSFSLLGSIVFLG